MQTLGGVGVQTIKEFQIVFKKLNFLIKQSFTYHNIKT